MFKSDDSGFCVKGLSRGSGGGHSVRVCCLRFFREKIRFIRVTEDMLAIKTCLISHDEADPSSARGAGAWEACVNEGVHQRVFTQSFSG